MGPSGPFWGGAPGREWPEPNDTPAARVFFRKHLDGSGL